MLAGNFRGLALLVRGGVTLRPLLSIGCTSDDVKSWPATSSLISYTSGNGKSATGAVPGQS